MNLIKDKDYFIITTNADHQFAINGFDMNRYFETQGNYIYFQCEKGCHRKVYYNEKIVKTMVAHTKNCQVPSYLVPVCPKCGRSMSVHVRKDGYFVETTGWEKHCYQYEQFLKNALRKKVVFIEIGVGFNTPTIIRYPFERYVYQHKNAYLIRMNKDYPFCMEGNEKKVISFDEPVLDIIEKLEEKEDV